MIPLASFLFCKQIKGMTGERSYRLIILLPFLIMAALAVFQVKTVTGIRGEHLSEIGLVTGTVFFLFILFGLFSNRFPSRMEDVTWIYTLPMPLESVVWTLILCQLILRGGLWWGAALLADLLRLYSGLPYEAVFIKATYGFLILAVIEIWLLAASACRAKPKLVATCGALSFIGLIAIAVATFAPEHGLVGLEVFRRYVRSSLSGFGVLLGGEMNSGALIALIALVIGAYAVIHHAVQDLHLKEKIVKEADFWSSFGSLNAMISSMRGTSVPSYWGGAKLAGTWSFLWVEWVIVKKNMSSLIGQFLLGALLSAVVAKWQPSWFGFVIGLILASTVLGAYFSGLVRHAQTGDLVQLPGHWFKKALLLESFHLLPLFATAALYIVIGLLLIENSRSVYLSLLYVLPAICVAVAGFRLHVFNHVYRTRKEVPIGCYYRILSGYGVASILVVVLAVGLLRSLSVDLVYLISPILVLLGVSHGWMSIRHFRS